MTGLYRNRPNATSGRTKIKGPLRKPNGRSGKQLRNPTDGQAHHI